jgi:hypothetical protein
MDGALAHYRRCAAAMLRTTAICGLGLAVYRFSAFPPAARFGWVISLLLTSALVGDLLFLPALLVSPLGRIVAGKCRPELSRAQPRASWISTILPRPTILADPMS